MEVEIFDPPMCCPTGMCGPTIDQALLDVNEIVRSLHSQSLRVARYQMTSHPNAFLNNADVMRLVRTQQMVLLSGEIRGVDRLPPGRQKVQCKYTLLEASHGPGRRKRVLVIYEN